ncbi:MAG: DNA-processing protein DprA [Syntrophomonadaceae bacterium]|nr:DNA-processing protein DprA [Syntrophomonadaceae bacterium]
MRREELAALVALHDTAKWGQRSLWKVKQHFGSMATAVNAGRDELLAAGLRTDAVDEWCSRRPAAERRMERLEELSAEGIGFCCVDDEDYPELLKNIFNPPYVFYYYGSLAAVHEACLAIVGSRAATPYGLKQAGLLAQELAAAGFTIVSGMARGIDTAAHRGALSAGGRTAAVLGSGIRVVYPPENRKLYDEIALNGVVISDFPVDMIPDPKNFPVRNRIISGLSYGTVIVEAAAKSGALITADAALEQGRDVFALPGPVSSRQSEGCHHLIRQGAMLVTSAKDILQEYEHLQKHAIAEKQEPLWPAAAAGLEDAILSLLDTEPCHVDNLMTELNCGLGELSAALIELELKGRISAMPGNCYVRL